MVRSRGHLDRVIDAINASGYGLTLGLYSRIASVPTVAERARVGKLYVNRTRSAPWSACSRSARACPALGLAAGGPHLARFAIERVRTTDITATEMWGR